MTVLCLKQGQDTVINKHWYDCARITKGHYYKYVVINPVNCYDCEQIKQVTVLTALGMTQNHDFLVLQLLRVLV